MLPKDKIYIAGHRGMVGASLVRALEKKGFKNLILKSSSQLDLTQQSDVALFFEQEKPDYVFMAAAKVGGIMANNIYRADFIYQNLMIASNVIHHSYKNQVKKLMFFGSSCIYPKLAPQPLKEEFLLTGPLEQTNEPYAIAKIAGIKLCESYRRQYGCNFISVMPTNLYGPGDNYHPENSHVLPALIRKFDEAVKHDLDEVIIWGSGNPLREFLYVDDLANASLMIMENYHEECFVNIGSGYDLSIRNLAETIAGIIGFKGKIVYDTSKLDGTPRKLMDNTKLLNMGWQPSVNLEEGIKMAWEDYRLRNA